MFYLLRTSYTPKDPTIPVNPWYLADSNKKIIGSYPKLSEACKYLCFTGEDEIQEKTKAIREYFKTHDSLTIEL